MARASSTVRDGHDFDFVIAYPMDQAERKEREHGASGTPAMTRPREQVLSDGIDRVSQLLAKSVGGGEISSRVPAMGPVDARARLMLDLAAGRIGRSDLIDWLRRHLKPLA